MADRPASSSSSTSVSASSGHDGPHGVEGGPENPVPHYLGALVVCGLVIGLAFIVRDESTRWVVVAVGIFMLLAVLIAFGKEMAGQRRS